jgi:hypothetical protein
MNPYNPDGSYRYDKDIDGFETLIFLSISLKKERIPLYTLKNHSLKAILDLNIKFQKA